MHCPECSTIITAAEGATRSETDRIGLHLETMYYNCPGCGKQYLHWRREYAHAEPVDQWFHVVEGKTLLMHQPPVY